MKCFICLKNITNEFIILPCGCKSIYHNKCIDRWFNIKKNCPTCRKEFKILYYNKCKTELLKKALFYDSINKYSQFSKINFQ